MESIEAGKLLKKAGVKIDECYTSFLSRAEQSLQIILDYIGQSTCPINRHWRLNERHYGALTGLNKKQTIEKYGREQVSIISHLNVLIYSDHVSLFFVLNTII